MIPISYPELELVIGSDPDHPHDRRYRDFHGDDFDQFQHEYAGPDHLRGHRRGEGGAANSICSAKATTTYPIFEAYAPKNLTSMGPIISRCWPIMPRPRIYGAI